MIFLVGCTITQLNPTITNTQIITSAPEDQKNTTEIPISDPCSGSWCQTIGIVYANEAVPGNELGGASVSLIQSSYCSPTSGQYYAISASDGTFHFDQLFFHDTDRVSIEAEFEGYQPAKWDATGFDFLSCFYAKHPIEIVLKGSENR